MSFLNPTEQVGFTFIWRIENFSFCTESKDEYIESPQFIVETLNKTEWFLVLYPRGDGDEAFIACYLQRAAIDDGPHTIMVSYKLSLVTADGCDGRSLKETRKFPFGRKCGTPNLMRRNEIVRGKEILTDDVLIIKCQLSKCTSKISEIGECLARTQIGVERRYFTWSIPDFARLEINKVQSFEVKAASKRDLSFLMALYLKGGFICDERIEIEIKQCNSQRPIFLTCQLFVLDKEGNSDDSQRDEHLFKPDNDMQPWHFPSFINRNKLMDRPNFYLPNGSLCLRCELAISTGVDAVQIDFVRYGTFSPLMSIVPNNSISISNNLANDMQSLYTEKELCDFIIKVGENVFPTHKAVLGARSAYFNAMLKHNVIEMQTSKVNIDNFDAETISRMLAYLYSEILNDVEWDSALELYRAANFFQIPSLKQECVSFLKVNLNITNACDILYMADQLQDGELKTVTQNFIFSQGTAVFKSVDWENLKSNNSQLALETLQCKM